MSLGSHFFIGIPDPVLTTATRKLLLKIQPGGIILFGRNVRSPRQVAKLTSDLRKLLGPRLMICLDHEGGRVNRLKNLVGVVPSAQQLGYLGKSSWAAKHGQLTGRLLRELGINVNLAPVLDLWLRPKTDNSVPDRCWSRKPHEVARLAGAFLRGMQAEGVVGCGKHFLGYGAADKDPHLVLPRVTRTKNQILREDLLPYKRLSRSGRSGLRLIMLSHAHLRAFHGKQLTPACISPIIVDKLLRKTLQFQGVSITDDLEMGAILRTMKIEEACVRCLERGTDYILICHTASAMLKGYHAAERAFKSGRLSPKILKISEQRLKYLERQFPPGPPFSLRRFQTIVKEIRQFTSQVFSKLPPSLCVIDERWGAIGEKYKV